MGLKVISESECLTVSLREAKKQVEISEYSTTHDHHLARLIRAATQQVEQRTGRTLINKQYRLTLDRLPYSSNSRSTFSLFSDNRSPHKNHFQEIHLPYPPLVSVDSIRYVDHFGNNKTLDPSQYIVGTNSEPGRLTPAYGETWPDTQYRIEAATIEFTAGYGDQSTNVPDIFRQAILIAVDHWFDPDESISNGKSSGLPGATLSLIDSLHVGVKYGSYGVTD